MDQVKNGEEKVGGIREDTEERLSDWAPGIPLLLRIIIPQTWVMLHSLQTNFLVSYHYCIPRNSLQVKIVPRSYSSYLTDKLK